MQRKYFFAGVLLLSLFVACKKGVRTDIPTIPSEETGFISSDQLKIDFAKALAKAMADPAVRALVKEEALKQFDKDYDVLFQLIKDREVKPGISFSKYLGSLSAPGSFDHAVEEAPLLNILVPHLKVFSAESWDTNSEIPLVAIVNNDFSEKNPTPYVAFDAEGNQTALASDKEPNRPVIVVKDNERIKGHAVNDRAARENKKNLVFSNSAYSFYLNVDSYVISNNDDESAARVLWPPNPISGPYPIDSKTKAMNIAGTPSQRDYIYYDIINPTDQGALRNDYAEYICGIGLNNSSSVNHVMGGDWGDGGLEFQVDILFFNGASALNKITKVITVPDGDLREGSNPKPIFEIPPVMITTWDMKAHGDTWKYVVTEIDPNQVITTTHTSSSKFGANFQFNPSLGKEVKTGIGFGATAETTSTNSTVVQTTLSSNVCGDAVVLFMHPFVQEQYGRWSYFLEELNTGTVKLVILPRKIGT